MNLSLTEDRVISPFQDLLQCECCEGSSSDPKTEFKGSMEKIFTFKICANLHNIHLTGETVSANYIAAMRFLVKLKMSQNSTHSPQEILILMRHFHIGNKCHHTHTRTHTHVKKMKTASSFKAPKLQLCLVFGGRAEGDVKLKTL
jgi:hypothetical protein